MFCRFCDAFEIASCTLVLSVTALLVGCGSNPESIGVRGESVTLPGITLQTVLVPRFVGAANNGGGAVNATATAAQGWETLSLQDVNGGSLVSGDKVTLQAGNGQYFQALNGGGSSLNAGSNSAQAWETFTLVRQAGAGTVANGDVIGLQASTGAWVSAQSGGGAAVLAYGGALGTWEQFKINGLPAVVTPPVAPPVVPPSTPSAATTLTDVHFRTLGGSYLGAQNNGGGAVVATAAAAQGWETFALIDANGGSLTSGDSVFVRAGNGQYFQALNGGGSSLNAGSNNQQGWETFKIVKANGTGAIKSGDTVGLQSSTGTWVSAENGGGGTVFAYGGALGSWESLVFTIGADSSSGGGAGGGTGGGSGGGSLTPPNVPGQRVLSGRGAVLNFVEYEAEAMTSTGSALGPTRTFGQSAAEASGRRAVRLGATGQAVSFTNATASNSIVVRYSIPDGGADYWTTLGVYVNGALRTRLSLTSRYSWTYGGDNDFNTTAQNSPSLGKAHHFWDESRALIGDIPVGATVMLRKDSADSAGYYDVDLVDMEQVAGPKAQPAGFLSLTADCGATANDGSDDSNALQSCVDRARGEGRGLYIPQGTFNSFSKVISVAGVTIRGAGMWYSTVYGYNAHFDCWGNNCQYYDFAISGDSTQRIDTATDAAFGGAGSSGVVLDGIWIEHSRVGYWTGAGTNGLVIRNSRIRDLFADGVNLYGGSSNCTLTNNHARNTGDDAFAAWSHSANGQGPDSNNVISFNYVQLPWKANCFALYGGNNNRIEDNVCSDVVQYPGILLARQFDSVPFSGTTSIARNTLIRAGAWAYNQEQGALKIHADQGAISGISVTNLDVQSPTYYAVHVQGTSSISGVTLSNVTVSNPGSGVFFLNWGANGSLTASNTTASGSPVGIRDDTSGAFKVNRGSGNSGW